MGFKPISLDESSTYRKAYRPISLTPFLLKTIERIINRIVKDWVNYDFLKFRQHTCMKGRSVKTVLNKVLYLAIC